ncbi:hypothetical protein AKJ42_02105 [candidate division MSBL1 archaeon SCGC-AAA261C02]|uniref:Nucleotidyl transferase AbiEii/AbiGii toxin family protein n=1 Tax=candidate division MSBL1 archaeon SCGC-AAA261C02 TaxID=1698272 RepID=A0A133V0H5_9EURY|nr:hypothetical protein AKJ42_02105 [candidate division MSBL1 archaeon SCGC-AAA261C02]
MHYDLNRLARKENFDVRVLEKLCRISDILEEISQDPLLKTRLSLTGGTALNLIHTKEIPRLSVDLDFNYRHVDDEDWGTVRDKIDDRLKKILRAMNYTSFSINATYPLGRITVDYTNQAGRNDKLKIEIGYMRRFPLLKNDTRMGFHHLGKDESIKVLTPKREELFAGKLITGITRRTPRDIFDIGTISQLEFNPTLLRKCTVLDSLTVEGLRFHELKLDRVFNQVSMDTNLANLLTRDSRRSTDFSKVKENAIEFCEEIQVNLTPSEIQAIEQFYDKGEFNPDLITTKNEFHEKMQRHPAITWAHSIGALRLSMRWVTRVNGQKACQSKYIYETSISRLIQPAARLGGRVMDLSKLLLRGLVVTRT